MTEQETEFGASKNLIFPPKIGAFQMLNANPYYIIPLLQCVDTRIRIAQKIKSLTQPF